MNDQGNQTPRSVHALQFLAFVSALAGAGALVVGFLFDAIDYGTALYAGASGLITGAVLFAFASVVENIHGIALDVAVLTDHLVPVEDEEDEEDEPETT